MISQKAESIDELLGLTSRLHAAGIDTSQMDEHIRKSAVVLAKELSTLLDKQANVTINGESFSAGADMLRKISRHGVRKRPANPIYIRLSFRRRPVSASVN